MSGRQPAHHPKDAAAFAEGAIRAKGGGVIGDNPHTLTEGSNAWADGFQAATTPAAWAADTAYTRGQMVTQSGNIYSCVIAGTSNSTGGPGAETDNTRPRIVDGTVTWQYQGAGSQVDLSCAGYPVAGAPPYVPVEPHA